MYHITQFELILVCFGSQIKNVDRQKKAWTPLRIVSEASPNAHSQYQATAHTIVQALTMLLLRVLLIWRFSETQFTYLTHFIYMSLQDFIP